MELSISFFAILSSGFLKKRKARNIKKTVMNKISKNQKILTNPVIRIKKINGTNNIAEKKVNIAFLFDLNLSTGINLYPPLL